MMEARTRIGPGALRTIAVVAFGALILAVAPASPAAAETSGSLRVTGGSASYRAGFRTLWPMTEGALWMTVRDTVADGYCVHGSVTYNVRNWPDPTYDSRNVCGYGTSILWGHNHRRYLPLAVDGMLVKVCKTIPSAPDPCSSYYIRR